MAPQESILGTFRLRLVAIISTISLIVVVLPSFFSPAAAADPSHVSFNLEGCRNDGTIILPIAGKFVCPDTAYTSGNLGKGWNELDLVPHRITASTGGQSPATQTYTVGIVADSIDGGKSGYDIISVPELNTTLSSASCTPASSNPSGGVGSQLTPGIGGTDTSLYRLLTITQLQSTTCVYDYYERLALGAALYPGSALHSNLMNENFGTQGIGAQDVSIPVKNAISPQELRKDMTASQGSDHVWNITKTRSPAEIHFGDTCDSESSRSSGVVIKVSWERLAATPSGDITVVTNVYAKNPASRIITVNVTDKIRSGTTVLDTATSGAIDIPANTELKVLTHTTTVPSGTTNLNDVATATYTDKVTGVPVPGTTQATASASVQLTGPELNQTAVITDTESLSSVHGKLSYSVDSTSGALGSFGSYTLGTKTKSPVTWTSEPQSGAGSVEFDKTVSVDEPAVDSGTLSDTATLTGSNGFTAHASASVDITSSALVSLDIRKTIPNVLQGNETQTFSFQVKNAGNNTVATPSITFNAGETDKTVTVTGLAPGTYTVSENQELGWGPVGSPQTVTINPPDCSAEVTFRNTNAPARARVEKITDPAGSEAGWDFTMTGPGTPAGGEVVTTTGSGFTDFSTQLQEGTYTVTETPQAGWDLTGVELDGSSVAECTFTVNYPADNDKVFSCSFTNTERGKIIVEKQTDPDGAAGDFTFTGDASGTIQDDGQIVVGDLKPGTYTSTESDPSAAFDLTGIDCNDSNSSGDVPSRTATFTLDPGETVKCVFTNVKRGTIIVEKQTDPNGAPGDFDFTGDASGTISDGGQIVVEHLKPGTYTSTETNPKPGFDLTDITCDDGNSSGDVGTLTATFKLEPAETVTCVFTNTQRGKIIVEKQTDPDGATGNFDFSGDASGTISDGGQIVVDHLKPGTYTSTETDPAPGFDLTDISCDDGNSSGDVGSETATFKVEPGETVTCVFTNTKRGTIRVQKLTDPKGADGDFTFIGDVSGTIQDGGTIAVHHLKPGLYSSTETDPSGFDLTNILCDDDNSTGDVGTKTASFTLDPGETVTCVFTNTQRGNIIVEKQTDPDGAPGSFGFTGDAAGSIGDGERILALNLKPGTYSSTEDDPAPGFDLTDITCDDSNSTGDVGARTATFNLDPGETVVCVFTNTERGKIIVEKQTDPNAASGNFGFTGDAAGTISDGGQIVVDHLKPGTYSSTEDDPTPGFDLTDITCDDSDSSGDTGSRTATFNLQAGETVTCVFTNTERGKIIVKKKTDPAGATGNFGFTGDAAGTISDGGQIAVNNLVPGQYTSTEDDPAPGFDLTDITCDDSDSSGDTGSRTATFNVDPGETVVCVFTNTQRGTIIVEKQTDPDGATGNFGFTGDAAGTISDGGQISVTDLEPGTYTSTEGDPTPAFDLTDITCDDSDSSGATGSRTATFNLQAGETVTCVFTNTQRGTVTVIKTLSGATPPAGTTFKFDLRTDASLDSLGNVIATGTTDASGNTDFGGVVLEPGDYQICELGIPVGGTSSLSDDPSSFVPNGNDPGADNSTICVPFHLDPGENQVFRVNNTPPPGGEARTIGYWKNWSSCGGSNGNQTFVLDQTLASFPGGGVFIGNLFVDTCREAVRLLGKRDVLSNKNRAKDGAYALAAQLLGAQLNVQAGAAHCPEADQAIIDGQALLVSIGFDGHGAYLGGRSATRRHAENLATTLDQYNNDTLC